MFLERKTKGSEYVEKLYVPINAITGEEFYDMEGNVKSYLKMDFYRMLTSKYFGIGILGVVGVYGFSLVQLKVRMYIC